MGTNTEASSPNGAGYLVHTVRTKCVLCGVADSTASCASNLANRCRVRPSVGEPAGARPYRGRLLPGVNRFGGRRRSLEPLNCFSSRCLRPRSLRFDDQAGLYRNAVIETAKLNDIDPQAWVADVITTGPSSRPADQRSPALATASTHRLSCLIEFGAASLATKARGECQWRRFHTMRRSRDDRVSFLLPGEPEKG